MRERSITADKKRTDTTPKIHHTDMKINRITIIVGLAILGLIYLLVAYPLWQVEDNTLEVFFGVFGVIYAIVAGFIMLVLLENYSAIKAHIWAEVNALQDLRDYLIYVDNQDHRVEEIKGTIKLYVESVIEREWLEMVSSGKTDMDTSAEIYAIMQSINKIEITNRSDAVALGKLIDTVGDITTHRTDRLFSSGEKLPFLLKPFILIMSILVILIFTFLPIDNFTIKLLLNGANVFAVVLIYLVILDLSHPFKGTWSISNEPFVDLLKRV